MVMGSSPRVKAPNKVSGMNNIGKLKMDNKMNKNFNPKAAISGGGNNKFNKLTGRLGGNPGRLGNQAATPKKPPQTFNKLRGGMANATGFKKY
jgi:hypothetical protein